MNAFLRNLKVGATGATVTNGRFKVKVVNYDLEAGHIHDKYADKAGDKFKDTAPRCPLTINERGP